MNENANSTRVLIIDDDWSTRELMQIVLRRAGYQVSAAGSGEEGLRLIEAMPPHVVIVDLQLGGMNGLDVIAHIRALDHQPRIAVIGMSASEGHHIHEQVQAVGGDLFISKVFIAGDLTAAVRGLLNMS